MSDLVGGVLWAAKRGTSKLAPAKAEYAPTGNTKHKGSIYNKEVLARQVWLPRFWDYAVLSHHGISSAFTPTLPVRHVSIVSTHPIPGPPS